MLFFQTRFDDLTLKIRVKVKHILFRNQKNGPNKVHLKRILRNKKVKQCFFQPLLLPIFQNIRMFVTNRAMRPL